MRLVGLCLLVVVLVPGALAWSVQLDVPGVAGAAAPFFVAVCVAGPPGAEVEARVALLVDGAPSGYVVQEGVEVSPRRYGPAFALDGAGRACRDVEVWPAGAAGEAVVEARARPAGGSAKADTQTTIVLMEAPFARVESRGPVMLRADGAALRLPVVGGESLVPLIPGARVVLDGVERPPPAALAWRVEEVRGGALEGVVLRNAGDASASLGGLDLSLGARSWKLPDIVLAPNESVALGRGAAPTDARHHPIDIDARAGTWRLLWHGVPLVEQEAPAPAAGWAWRAGADVRLGAQVPPASPLTARGELIAYATPDAGAAPLIGLIEGAREEILAELYTLTSPDIVDALAGALDRGARVSILLEGAPAGGRPADQDALVAALVARGAQVAFLESADGFPARFRTQHAKTFVIDREWMHVATENPTPKSYPSLAGSEGTRGFGIAVRNATLAAWFADLHARDAAAWPDIKPARIDELPAPARLAPSPAAASGPVLRLDGAWNVRPMLSPHGSLDETALLGAIAGAERRVDVAMLLAQPVWPDGPNPFLDALVDAARRGVEVRLLMDGRFQSAYNEATLHRLQAQADREGIPIQARLAHPGETLHAKLVLADDAAYIGSMNWGAASARDNREAGLIVENATLAEWLGGWFEKDWQKAGMTEAPPPPGRQVPANGLGWVLALSGAGAWFSRRPRRRTSPC